MQIPENVIRRFERKTIKTSGCWLWSGVANNSGYGSMACPSIFGQPRTLAHRLAWMINFGPIPMDKEVCHRCDVRICVNPEHLYLGTHRENMLDMFNKGRNLIKPGSLHPYARLSESDVLEIRRRRASGETGRSLALQFGVSFQHLSDIVLRKRWAYLPAEVV
jgi:hypothetical protein